uniref:Uncharacterized protein n=1 Tax=Amblyomma aureolatum TaxID=187763 RepID=A0A1E1XD96_9ACAR
MQQAAAEAEALRKAKRSQKLHQLLPPVQLDQQGSSFDTTGSVDADFSTSLDRISSSMAGMSNIGSEDQTDLSTQQNISSAGMPSQTVPMPASQPQARPTYTLATPAATVRPSLRGGDSDVAAGNKALREVCCQTDGSLSASVCSSRCSMLSSAGMVELNPYIENRVLTPTKVRIAQHALLRSRQQHCREFGIQTDISLPCGWNHSILCDDRVRLTQEFENRSSLREFPPYTSAVRRLQHSLPLRGVHRNDSGYTPCENLRDAGATRQTPMAATKGRVADVLPATIARSSAQRLQELRRQHCERESGARRLRAVSQFSSQVGRGGVVERNRGRAPVRATGQVPTRFEEEAAHNMTQSDEEDSTIHDSSGHRLVQSPPVPALREKVLLPSPRSDHISNTENSSSEAATTPGKCHDTPPASRKRWRQQEVYVPQHPIGEAASPKQSSPNRGKVDNTAVRDHQPLGIVERQRSVSVSGARRSQSPSPHRRPQRSSSQDPLVHPELVTSCPTRRQDKILQQLFTLRQGLLIKQREMESHLVKVKP